MRPVRESLWAQRARLESIVQQLEEGDLGLAEALDQYEHGIKLRFIAPGESPQPIGQHRVDAGALLESADPGPFEHLVIHGYG